VTDGSCFPLNKVQRVIICDGWIMFSLKYGSASHICNGWILFSVKKGSANHNLLRMDLGLW
jgi:hypothetical protein